MTWIKRTRRAATAARGCDCTPPMYTPTRTMWAPHGAQHTVPLPPRPDGLYGDLWQCDNCGTVWKIGTVLVPGVQSKYGRNWIRKIGWTRASWWTQYRHRNGTTVATEHIGDGLRSRIDTAERGEQ